MTRPTALDLAELDPLPDEIRRYFEICQEKLGLVPNVLRAYGFDAVKFGGFHGHLQRADAGGLRGFEARTRDDRGGGVGRNRGLLLLPHRAHGAAVRRLSGYPDLGEKIVMNYRWRRPRRPQGDAGFRGAG